MTAFGERVRDLRVKNGVSIKRLSNGIGIHKSTVIRWERGETIPRSPEIISLLSKFFHVPRDYFFTDEPFTPPDIRTEVIRLREEINVLRKVVSRLEKESRLPS